MHTLQRQAIVRVQPVHAPAQRKQAHERLEHDANRTAERVLRSGPVSAAALRDCGSGGPRCAAAPAASGAGLDAATRRWFEPRFAADFSQVRVHHDAAAAASARRLHADAYTAGNHIVFDSGRHAPTTRGGLRLLTHELAHVVQQARGLTPGPIIQRQETVGTNYGEFETTQFAPHASGVEITLLFNPDKAKVDASKIALVQSVRAFNQAGTSYAVNPSIAARMVPKGKGAGYAIDASGASNNPLYFDLQNLGDNQDLKDTPGPTAQQPVLGSNTHNDFGYCFRVNPSDADKSTHPAGLSDRPDGIAKAGAGMAFETTALALDGADKGTYYGAVKWGYKMVKQAGGIVAVGNDIQQASAAKPTANFSAPAKLWNAGKTAGSLVVAPSSRLNKKDASALDVATGTYFRIAKGTPIQQTAAIKGTTEGMIEAKVLKTGGNVTAGQLINIYVVDVKDQGDGTANKPLP